jgi:hypothetical protein
VRFMILVYSLPPRGATWRDVRNDHGAERGTVPGLSSIFFVMNGELRK